MSAPTAMWRCHDAIQELERLQISNDVGADDSKEGIVAGGAGQAVRGAVVQQRAAGSRSEVYGRGGVNDRRNANRQYVLRQPSSLQRLKRRQIGIVRGGARDQQRVIRPANQAIAAIAADENVVALAAVEPIVAVAADEDVAAL